MTKCFTYDAIVAISFGKKNDRPHLNSDCRRVSTTGGATIKEEMPDRRHRSPSPDRRRGPESPISGRPESPTYLELLQRRREAARHEEEDRKRSGGQLNPRLAYCPGLAPLTLAHSPLPLGLSRKQQELEAQLIAEETARRVEEAIRQRVEEELRSDRVQRLIEARVEEPPASQTKEARDPILTIFGSVRPAGPHPWYSCGVAGRIGLNDRCVPSIPFVCPLRPVALAPVIVTALDTVTLVLAAI
ncbi:hypothetical protein PAPYR_3627 [Paratrimastix pyriformis]|uniref:Uncharacterized protein n=1 Tax=Paratrimastix pyriformis TaxID=342808 RepID=A0ABQ8UP60_9EUKA|nr:hypothetical protein PAPYR_3627 [Paratrimastix pyriformis]